MNAQSPFFAVIIFGIAFVSGYFLQKTLPLSAAKGRYETIDGLRGFLALGVFIHHAHIWQQYLQTGKWGEPASNLYNHLGQTSVAFFFMITSFLFISRLLNQQEKAMNWRSFFLSRVFRIVPLYFFTVVATVFLVMAAGNWQLNTNLPDFLKSIAAWLLFTIVKTPINNSEYTFLVTGVTWSLPYEWLFYFSLPLIALVISKSKPKKWLLVACVAVVAIFYLVHGIEPYYVLAFAGGTVAPILLKYVPPGDKFQGTFGSMVVLLCFILLGQFHSANNIFSLLLISLIFTIIATGNSFFGLLQHPALKLLGEISYSTYLLHGMVLFCTFYFGLGLENARELSPLTYTLVIFVLTPVMVLVSYFGFRFIEKPFILKGQALIQKLKFSGKPALTSSTDLALTKSGRS